MLVVGAGGQLAQALLRRLQGATGLERLQADVSSQDAVVRLLDALRPRIVFNCAAYNNVDQAEQNDAEALRVNARGPAHLAEACDGIGATLVHFSTNYVFGADEARRIPYTEADEPQPINRYGASKLLGERAIDASRHLIIRTCGLFGQRSPLPRNFVSRLMQRAQRQDPLCVVADQTCTPTGTDDLAVATLALVAARATGIFHVTNGGSCTWFEFAQTILCLARISVNLRPVSSAELGAPARRPGYSVLDCARYEACAGGRLRDWKAALREYLERERIVPT